MPKLQNSWASGELVVRPGLPGPGNDYFVNSNTGSDSYSGEDWEHAKATTDAAIAITGVEAGDTIWVAPNHTETLNSNEALDVDVAGIRVVGIVRGRLMPTYTITHTAAALVLAAANCTLANVRVLGGVDIIVSAFEVVAADCALINCEYRDVTGEATDSILTTAAADRLLIDGYRHIGSASAGASSAIAIVGADDTIIRNFDIYANASVAAIDFRTTLSARVHVHSGYIWNVHANDIAIKDSAGSSTGAIGPDILIRLNDDSDNITTAITGATFHVFDPIMVVNAVDEVGMEINWSGSADT